MKNAHPSMKPEVRAAVEGSAILTQDRAAAQSLQLASSVQPCRDVLPLVPASAMPTMSSREIAELTGKRHGDVIRDIRVMLDALAGDDAVLRHVYEERDARGYTVLINLPKDLVITLVSGYSVQMRHRIVTRWLELETAVHDRAVEALERLARAHGPISLSDAAKDLHQPPRAFTRWIEARGWVFRDLRGNLHAAQARLNDGTLEQRPVPVETDNGLWLRQQVRVTPKGLVRLAELLTEQALALPAPRPTNRRERRA